MVLNFISFTLLLSSGDPANCDLATPNCTVGCHFAYRNDSLLLLPLLLLPLQRRDPHRFFLQKLQLVTMYRSTGHWIKRGTMLLCCARIQMIDIDIEFNT